MDKHILEIEPNEILFKLKGVYKQESQEDDWFYIKFFGITTILTSILIYLWREHVLPPQSSGAALLILISLASLFLCFEVDRHRGLTYEFTHHEVVQRNRSQRIIKKLSISEIESIQIVRDVDDVPEYEDDMYDLVMVINALHDSIRISISQPRYYRLYKKLEMLGFELPKD